MNLEKYKIADLFLAALKAENEAQKTYLALAGRTENGLFGAKLLFLADEEQRHITLLEKMYKKETGQKSVKLPRDTPVPFLTSKIPANLTPVGLLANATEVEKAATEFYASFATMFSRESDESFLLAYFSAMERGHLKLLENELEYLKKAVSADRPFPRMVR